MTNNNLLKDMKCETKHSLQQQLATNSLTRAAMIRIKVLIVCVVSQQQINTDLCLSNIFGYASTWVIAMHRIGFFRAFAKETIWNNFYVLVFNAAPRIF